MNLANRLTLIRIFMIPLFMIFLLTRIPYGEYIAATVFVLAAGTDGLDGYIARTRKEVTKLGKLMDPLADKLLVSAALISLVELDKIPAWIAVVIIGREFAVSGLRAVAAGEGVVVSASIWGKLKTLTQIIAIVAILIHDFPFNLINFPIGQVALYVAVIFTLFSGIEYFIRAQKILSVK
ncbi:CDP-diacylglycerol--glycerol-3-phosphate 3-phosphatidyltransferase [Calderihabitans maritimus]|uniref:CDP-diacylglycerol--glycerol-3-phosphate 3-phosphatidyltransferase n=1 Tax=Calderihabitans maritimus TaxID=1246530 RepID=A0A1Z5HPU2_9FIRM|nr:CDP-diacylglycerol--glycerol-3-phosphate 3-phosphatidyltransferase [Calderihabitans maritimus]GAW91543.1 CDP-diacylglycerol--glycerol-3-phosphate 3-phosphatidyltransferase [Calderihabitans maritimus]